MSEFWDFRALFYLPKLLRYAWHIPEVVRTFHMYYLYTEKYVPICKK
jgi:hypothetical protein